MNTTATGLLITLNVPPALEDDVADWLLEHDAGRGFTNCRVDGHSTRHGHLSAAEQVRGRERRVEFRVVIEPDRSEALIDALGQTFARADIFYFVTPVLQSGHLGISGAADPTP